MGVLALVPLLAAAEESWQTIATGTITIRTRAKPGTAVREIWAEGPIDAPAYFIQQAITDAEAYPRFMPYVKESRYLGQPDSSGNRFVYTRLDLPFVSGRDYVVKVSVDKSIDEDGTGEFHNHWEARANLVPEKPNVVRLRFNEGSWRVIPKGPHKSWVVYRFAVDPGGWVPAFAADMGNKTGVMDAFQAVEREAKRRELAHARKTQGVGGSGPSAPNN